MEGRIPGLVYDTPAIQALMDFIVDSNKKFGEDWVLHDFTGKVVQLRSLKLLAKGYEQDWHMEISYVDDSLLLGGTLSVVMNGVERWRMHCDEMTAYLHSLANPPTTKPIRPERPLTRRIPDFIGQVLMNLPRKGNYAENTANERMARKRKK